ncbi:hypothetical protein C8R42DRAFT_718335 [Lentinula raphanica]|nr:hypothetical protein C8R42DRAFT_718335 [Lentinula raphanica]
MVHTCSVLIFVALGAAAPLRLMPSVEPAGQEAALACAHFDRDTPESVNPQDCVESEFNHNVSIGEYNVLDMNSFLSRRGDSSGINLLPPFDSPSSQDDDASVLSIESCAPHPSGPFDSPLSQEHEDADTISDPSISSRAPHPSGPFYSPSSQEHVDAITADVPGIESRAPHPSGPYVSPSSQERADSCAPYRPSGILEISRRSLGVLSSRSSNAPVPRHLLRKRTDTEVAGTDDLQPTSAFSMSFPSVNAFSEQHMPDAREENDMSDAHEENDLEKDKIITIHSVASHVPDSSGPPQSFSASNTLDHPLLRERIDTDIASTHTIESRSRSPYPHGPLVVSHDMDAYYLSQISKTTSAEEVVQVIKLNTGSYETDIQGRTSWADFLQTRAGQFWLVVDRILEQTRPNIDRISVKIEIMADIIVPRLDNVSSWKLPISIYQQVRAWNLNLYWDDTKASTDFDDWLLKDTGKLYLKIEKLITCAPSPRPIDRSVVSFLFGEDIRGLSADEKANSRLEKVLTSTGKEYDDVAAALRRAQTSMDQFRSKSTPCLTRFKHWKDMSTPDIANLLEQKMRKKLQEAAIDKLVLPVH